MRFLFTVLLILVTDVVLLWYLGGSQYFSPWNRSGGVDIANVSLFIILVSIAAGLISALLVYFGEKLLYCGWREFPSPMRALKIAVGVVLICVLFLVMHIFHLLSGYVVLIVCALFLVGVIIVR